HASVSNSSLTVSRNWNFMSSLMEFCLLAPSQRGITSLRLALFRRRLGRAGRYGRRGRLRRGTLRRFGCAIPIAGLGQAGTDLGNLAEIEQCVVRGAVMIEHAEINFALIRERLNQGDRRWGDGQGAARMRPHGGVYGLALTDAVADAYVGSAFDEPPDADRELGLAILAAHQQMGLAIARWQRRRDQGAVIEGGFFVVDHPRRTRARL